MSLGAAMAATGIVSGLSQIGQGISAYQQGSTQSKLFKEQGKQQAREAEALTRSKAREVRKFQARQKGVFLKSGVQLSGSPLLVLDETRRLGQEEINSIAARGEAKAKLSYQQAGLAKARGRSALLGSFVKAGTTLMNTYIGGKTRGAFGGAGADPTAGMEAPKPPAGLDLPGMGDPLLGGNPGLGDVNPLEDIIKDPNLFGGGL